MTNASKTASLRLSYRELEILVRALHSGNAELYCDSAALATPEEREVAEDRDRADMELCEHLRNRVCGLLDRMDAVKAVSGGRKAA